MKTLGILSILLLNVGAAQADPDCRKILTFVSASEFKIEPTGTFSPNFINENEILIKYPNARVQRVAVVEKIVPAMNVSAGDYNKTDQYEYYIPVEVNGSVFPMLYDPVTFKGAVFAKPKFYSSGQLIPREPLSFPKLRKSNLKTRVLIESYSEIVKKFTTEQMTAAIDAKDPFFLKTKIEEPTTSLWTEALGIISSKFASFNISKKFLINIISYHVQSRFHPQFTRPNSQKVLPMILASTRFLSEPTSIEANWMNSKSNFKPLESDSTPQFTERYWLDGKEIKEGSKILMRFPNGKLEEVQIKIKSVEGGKISGSTGGGDWAASEIPLIPMTSTDGITGYVQYGKDMELSFRWP